MKNIILSVGMYAIVSVSAAGAYAQDLSGHEASTKQDRLSPAALRSYLRQPDGLQRLSSSIQDNIVFTEGAERWGEDTLSSLTKSSDRVLIATVVDRRSRLTENGDSISTTYSLQPVESIKGIARGPIEVTYGGGKVGFPNGYSATIHTLYWDGLKAGSQYLFFLTEQNNTFYPVGNEQGVLELRDTDNSIHTLGESDLSRPLEQEINSASITTVKDKIRTASE